ncbi:aminotransferase class I/II-fold pyridoxal phosphate-dependent enzyme [Aureibaculum sp. 2210JD6-5]|uniref:aminotransferase class I/II-fold pyridoxal phosphate-dependent enzyme n=1 Tax=Aureibaculum sp. 2210JD6-5 TaxID=3103957 RepID=UPI002AACC02E|nr:aminotransferase class I/II-fold pyridoxal phosphate-dependent enzyme [Aureibaculum sp. 2210JD6-5]MDY7395649.1 aminotransferase class I/II-fold pyridoxal phosphate-dependent enzyme [Aureibaculum sp. 2210JD6-5]
MIVENFPGRTISIKGKKYLYFGGTAYLGLATHPEFQSILMKSIQKWGTFYGSSRNSNIKLAIYNQFEDFFAQQIGAEASLTVSSGTLAGRLVVDFLAKSNPAFFHYPKTHPAILAKESLPLFVNNRLHSQLINNTSEEIVITVDAILGSEVEPVSFDFLDTISASKKITLVVDESHSLGIVGKEGQGIFNDVNHKNIKRKIMVSSLGKALSLSGGIIACDQQFIDALKEESTFVSSSAANPAYLEAYCKGEQIYQSQKEKLSSNLNFIEEKLHQNETIKFNKNYPVIYSKDDHIYDKLFEENIIITNFKYPTYKKMMNRIVITANHKQEDLEKLVQTLNKKL